MPDEAGEKTEAPTPQRIREARENGQVAKSQDLSAAVGLLSAMALLNICGPRIMAGFASIVRHCLGMQDIPNSGAELLQQSWRLMLNHASLILMPFFVVLMISAIVANVMQTGLLLSLKPITPSFEKVSPLKGIERLFSVRTLMRMVMNLAKVGIIGTIAYYTIKSFIPGIVGAAGLSYAEVFSYGAGLMFKLGLRLAVVLFVLALMDYAWQKYKHVQDLRMTKEEVKEELKRMEGDAVMKARRRAVARELAAKRMSQAVPNADVVITNPTELAIALKYDHKSDAAPKVVARGAGFIAGRIRAIANENGVPIVERKPLAQALYRACDVGDYVPPELYKAVAEVLAYVFELAGKGFRRTAAS
jgi:flagellar biosynthetic protein FlhB